MEGEEHGGGPPEGPQQRAFDQDRSETAPESGWSSPPPLSVTCHLRVHVTTQSSEFQDSARSHEIFKARRLVHTINCRPIHEVKSEPRDIHSPGKEAGITAPRLYLYLRLCGI
jgi:hypothetical protein